MTGDIVGMGGAGAEQRGEKAPAAQLSSNRQRCESRGGPLENRRDSRKKEYPSEETRNSLGAEREAKDWGKLGGVEIEEQKETHVLKMLA